MPQVLRSSSPRAWRTPLPTRTFSAEGDDPVLLCIRALEPLKGWGMGFATRQHGLDSRIR